MMVEPLLEIKDLCIAYDTRGGDVPAVIDFDLSLQPGQTVGLVGESGCGKTTVAMAVMRYLGRNGRVTSGGIRFDGQDLLAAGEAELRRLRGSAIAMVYQEPMAALNPSMRIGHQLAEVPLFHDGASREEALDRARSILADVHLPDPGRIMDAYPHQLSGGQQQRIVIAMALLSNPKLLLLDEPTTALDVTVEAGIVELIREIGRTYGTSMLYISHNLGLIRETCERVCVMYSGRAVEVGAIHDIFEAPRHPYTKGLFECIPLPTKDRFSRPLRPIKGQLPLPQERPRGCAFAPRCAHTQAGLCDADGIPMEPTGHGHDVRCVRWRDLEGVVQEPAIAQAESQTGAPVLKVVDLKKHYVVGDDASAVFVRGREVRTVKANEGLNFEAFEGETVAIVGESGCGKSTFARVLTGLEQATGGTIEFRGDEIGDTRVQDRPAEQVRDLQMVFQNPFDTLNPSQTVGSQIGRVIRKFSGEKTGGRVRQRVLEMLDLVQLPREFAGRLPRQLSGGQKQRVAIARAFAGDPSTVIADEPVSALDVSVAAAITRLLLDIQGRNRTTLLFISHDLSLVRYLADRVIVMYLGQIMEQGTVEEIFEPPYHPYTEALLSAVPVADTRIKKRRILLDGAPPSPLNAPRGCPFASRCPHKVGAICDTDPPPQRQAGGHAIACHIPLDELRETEPVFSQLALAAE